MTRMSKTAGKAKVRKVTAPQPRPMGPVSVAPREDVTPLIERVVAIIEEARAQVVRTVNSAMVLAYWHIGRELVEFVQRGAKRTEYGEQVLAVLSARLREWVDRAARPRTFGTSAPSTWRSEKGLRRFATSEVANLDATVVAQPWGFATSEVASQTSNWTRRSLDADRLNYAALDAEVLLALHERFKDVGGAPDAEGGN